MGMSTYYRKQFGTPQDTATEAPFEYIIPTKETEEDMADKGAMAKDKAIDKKMTAAQMKADISADKKQLATKVKAERKGKK